jgi:hypothetical protein
MVISPNRQTAKLIENHRKEPSQSDFVDPQESQASGICLNLAYVTNVTLRHLLHLI